jgi:hypothetical protein
MTVLVPAFSVCRALGIQNGYVNDTTYTMRLGTKQLSVESNPTMPKQMRQRFEAKSHVVDTATGMNIYGTCTVMTTGKNVDLSIDLRAFTMFFGARAEITADNHVIVSANDRATITLDIAMLPTTLGSAVDGKAARVQGNVGIGGVPMPTPNAGNGGGMILPDSNLLRWGANLPSEGDVIPAPPTWTEKEFQDNYKQLSAEIMKEMGKNPDGSKIIGFDNVSYVRQKLEKARKRHDWALANLQTARTRNSGLAIATLEEGLSLQEQTRLESMLAQLTK